MKHTLVTIAVALCCGFAGSVGAAMSKEDYKAQTDRIKADYKAANDKCGPLKANAQDICKAEAKGNYNVAKAELEQQYKPSPRNEAKAKTEKADADYKVAVEKCDDLAGNAKASCKTDAKAAMKTAKADATKTAGQSSTKAAGAGKQ